MSVLKDSFPIKPNPSVILTPIESPSSPHDVSDIIHSFFGPQLADSKDQLSSKDIHTNSTGNMMALAVIEKEKKPTEEDDYHQKKLDLYTKLEQEIQQAIAKQLTEQENQLKITQERHPNFTTPHLLQEPCPISRFLDERLLQAEGLLVSSDYRLETQTSHIPPHREWPSYMESTVTSKLHAKVQSSLPHKKSPIKLPPVWKNSLSSEEREIAKKSFSELYRKTDFPQSTKYRDSSNSLGGSLKKRQSKFDGIKRKEINLFRGEPSQVVFTNYTPGKTYEATLVIKNISETSQQMSVTSPSTSYFKTKLIQFPSSNEGGIIAPGMSRTYSISFTPDSLADFTDEITVLSHIGKVLSIPLIGYRPPPKLSLPMVWELGHCLVAGCTVMTLKCDNTGGEGNFKFMAASESAELNEEECILSVGPFTITPTVFSLSNGDTIDIKVTFRPQEVIEVSHQIIMICDNGQETIITIKGRGEMVNIGCIGISPVSSTDTYNTTSEAIDSPVIVFEPTNPCIPVYHVAVIKNYSNVCLAYEWNFYHPRTQLTHFDGTTELSPPVPFPYSSFSSLPFSVDHNSGALQPGECKPFTFCLLTDNKIECGSIEAMAYLELIDIPKPSLNVDQEGVSWIKLKQNDDVLRVAVICIDLQGTIEPYKVNFNPPVISLPFELAPCTEIRKEFTINNNSLNDVKINCPLIETPQVTLTVIPSSNIIVPGGASQCQLVVNSTDVKGVFNIPVECFLEHGRVPFKLPVKGKVKAPRVTIDTGCIQFGLIELGKTATSSFQLTNHSQCNQLKYELRQIIIEGGTSLKEEEEELLPVIDYKCLDLSPFHGELKAQSSITITVTCSPNVRIGHLRTAIECLIGDERMCIIGVTAEVQRPMLVLVDSTLHIDNCYMTVPVKHKLTLLNITQLSTHYQWINEQRDQVDVRFTPDNGPIGPNESITIEVESNWKIKGDHTGVMAVCCAQGMDYPVILSLSAHVLGLSITYTIENRDKSLSLPMMDFGLCNNVREPQTLILTVTNTSAISSHLTAFVRHFPSTPLHTCTDNKPKSLLQSTNNLTKSSSKTIKKAKEELISYLLSDGRGACFTVEPSQVTLSPFQSQLITVTAYSDMWGLYNDILTFKVAGLDARIIPVQYGVTSTPIYFQPTATYDNTQVRLGCHPAGSSLVKRIIKLTNVSSTVIRINWKPFYIDPKDDKIIDLISYVGSPFPLQQQDDNIITDKERGSSMVRVHMFPHEGKPSKEVFRITPEQLVIEPGAQTSVEVTFDPSITAYNEIGEHVNGYILGYLTIINDKSATPTSLHVSRLQGYDTKPARINISASITHPRLHIKTRTDDNDLTFYHLASEFFLNDQNASISSNRTTTKRHHFSLINQTLTNLSFHILPMNNKELNLSLADITTCTNDSFYTLKPKQSIEGSILISLTHQALLDLINKHCQLNDSCCPQKIKLTDTLTIVYSTGAKQEFPINFVLCLPTLSVQPSLLDYGTGLIGRPLLSSFQLRNSSDSSTRWTITIPHEWKDAVQVDAETGTLESIPQTIMVTFTPKSEVHYSIALHVTDAITQYTFTVTITGVGSADEKYKRQKQRKRK